jgi:alpha-glucoside transport system substrate-binding protein
MTRRFRFIVPLTVFALVLAACAPDEPGATPDPGEDVDLEGTTITITSLWGGAEEEAFLEVVGAFEEETGVTVTYQPQRTDYAAVLRTRIEGGDPPDIAIIPGIGFLRTFALTGDLVPLSEMGINLEDIEGNYAPGMLDAGIVDGELYAVMVKLNSKATIWYRPDVFEDEGVSPPESWDEMVQLTEDLKAAGWDSPWALGAGDGWTLTDWFENIYLRQHGEEMYDQLFSGELPWTDPSVEQSIELMQEILSEDNVVGGIDGALGTGFVDAIGLIYRPDPAAPLFYGGGFVGGIARGDVNPDLTWQEDHDFFEFPTIDGQGAGAIVFGGDVIATFDNRPEVAAFIRYMTTAEAGQTWAEQGTIISPIRDVDVSVYPEEVQKEAEQVRDASVARFDGSDLLPGPDLGAVLQSAIRGEDLGPLLENFEDEVARAWAETQ